MITDGGGAFMGGGQIAVDAEPLSTRDRVRRVLRRAGLVVGCFFVLLVGAACVQPPAEDPNPAPPPTVPAPGAPSETNTIVTPEAGDTAPVTATIDVAGGELSVTDGVGRVYRLVFPAGAVSEPTDITMTPLGGTGGVPFGETPLFAIDLQPEGLVLTVPASLAVTFPVVLPPDVQPEVLGFGWDNDDGQAFHRRPTVSGNTLTLDIFHFSGAGAGSGTPSQKRAWAQEVAAAYTPSATLAREGTDYQKGANARIRSANESAELGLISRAEADLLIVEELTEWVEDRLALMIAGDTPTRPKLTQALQEYNLLRSLAQQQGMNDFLTGPLAAFEADLKADWLTLYQSNQAPKCSAPMPDASDPFQHVFHISAISLANGWDFPTPSYPEDFCTQIKLVDAQAPPVVADEEGAPSGAVVNVSASYSIRTPAPGPPEEIEDRFARGTSHTVEADDSASICIVIDQGGTLQGEGCAPFEGSSSGQTATFTIDPSGVADLKVTLTLNLASLQIVTGSGEANTRELTSLRDVRELTLATPTSDLVAAPSTTPVCALVTRPKVTGSTAARAPEAGVTVRYDKQTSGGTIPSTMPIPEGPTGADGRFCADYVLSGLAKPSATSLSVRDLVTANATKTTGLPLTAVINMAPDWIDVRFFRSPGAGTLLERMLVVPTSHAFDSNRFSRWQAVVVRRDPFGTGPVVIEPDPDGDGVPRIGVTPGDGAIAIGGTQGGVGVATRVGDATLPFQICVCDAAVIAAGTTAVTFDARVGGITVSRQLDVSWTKLRDPDPPPPPPPPPPDNPPGPTTTVQDRTVYARVTTQDGRYIQGPGLHRATIQLMESSYYNTLSAELLGPLEVNPVLTRETLLTIEGQSRHCPGFSQFDGFFSGCGGGFSTGSGRVNDIEIEISGTHTLIKFHEGPRTFEATKVTRIRNFDGTYDEHVENITIIPGEPPDQGGGGGGGGGGGAGDGTRPPDDCLVSEAHVIGGASRNGSGGGAA